MRTCDDIRTRIGPYLDDELDAAAERAVRSHLESCAPCAERLEAERAFLARIAAAGRETAPASLRARVETILRSAETETTEPASADRRLPWGALVPLAVAAGVAALLLVTTPWSGGPDPRAVAAAEGFAADHAAHAIERPSLQPVESGAPDPPVIPGGELAGSSRCLIGEEPYAHYTYAVDGRHVSIYLPFDGEAPPRAGRPVEVEGIHVLGVDPVDGGAGAVIVSDDVEPDALTELWNLTRSGPGSRDRLHSRAAAPGSAALRIVRNGAAIPPHRALRAGRIDPLGATPFPRPETGPGPVRFPVPLRFPVRRSL